MSSSKILRSYLEILSEKGGGGKAGGAGAAPRAGAPIAPGQPIKPGQPTNLAQTTTVQQKTRQGLRTVGKSLTGQNPTAIGQATKGLDKISQGSPVTGAQSAALEPFIEPLQMILANPQLKPRFLALVTQAKQLTAKIDPTALTTSESE
jgi:hypothetical protein